MRPLIQSIPLPGIRLFSVVAIAGMAGSLALPAAPLAERLQAAHGDFLEDRRAALPSLSDPFGVPAVARMVLETSDAPLLSSGMEWKRNVVATVFWVGSESQASGSKAISAWDPNWHENFGGTDHPEQRDGWLPKGFVPSHNPFYVALPYNDVAEGGFHTFEASRVIPWFWRAYRGEGISVCKSRWVAIHYKGRVCYAQWEDVGPGESDDWRYVFGDQAPANMRNKGSGMALSPAVRDFLGFNDGQRVQWRFVDSRDIPQGPWSGWGHAAAK